MGKQFPKYDHDEDGFMRLIPRTLNVTGCSIHEGQDSVEYWKNRCMKAEEKVKRLEREIDSVYQLLEEATEQCKKDIAKLEEELNAEPSGYDSPYASVDDRLNCGLGLSFGPGQDPRLYRLSDRDGDLSSSEKFAGGEVEIQPGRGFHIGLHWRKK